MNRRDGARRPDDCDPYYKKDITVDIGGRGLVFRVSQTLFSSYGIDAGTELLLRTLHREGGEFRKVLDLGCGYGPIGIALKCLNPAAALHMVDRDALAVRYAAQNAQLNGVDDALVYPSIAFDDVEDRDFDLIAMNMPGKGGEAVIASWLRAAPLHLGRNGKVAVVVVSPLEPLVNEAVAGIPGAGVVLRRRRAGHTVLVFSVDDGQDPPHPLVRSFDRGDYDRSDVTFVHGQTSYSMRTVFGLPAVRLTELPDDVALQRVGESRPTANRTQRTGAEPRTGPRPGPPCEGIDARLHRHGRQGPIGLTVLGKEPHPERL